MHENAVGDVIVAEAIEVHRETGPGLFESVYEPILAYRLEQAGLNVERQVSVPLEYQGICFDEAFRVDLIVESRVIIELKSVASLTNTHKKQLLTYLRLTGLHLGYLLNFNESLMKNGIHRIVNNLHPP